MMMVPPDDPLQLTLFQHQHVLQTHTWPFHQGELKVQLKLGAYEYVNSYAPKFIRDFMPQQHREFYQNQPFLVAAARDDNGKLWSTLLFSSSSSAAAPSSSSEMMENSLFFVQSPDSKTLVLDTKPLPGDALEGCFLLPGSDLGLLGIEFATRRRNRVNGRVVSNNNGDNRITFSVDQSFGNCPQYIKPRSVWWTATTHNDKKNQTVCPEPSAAPTRTKTKTQRPNRLSPEQLQKVRQAETIFLATGYRGHGENPAYGNDASHRGGSAGFLDVVQQEDDGPTIIILPDYNGNHHFNTIGNLVQDPSMGITIPLYETGGMIQLSGQGTIIWDDDPFVDQYVGAKRLIQFVVDEIVELKEGSLPLRWKTSPEQEQMTLEVTRRVKESDTVTSFYLASVPGESPKLPSFQAGQHLPVTIAMPNGTTLERSYSLSNYYNDKGQAAGEYRISVQKEPMGQASTFLHDYMKVGNLIQAGQPAGDFVYPASDTTESSTTFIFLSAGIGVTPVLSMLYAFAADKSRKKSSALWIHSAKDRDHHPFAAEVERLQSKVASAGGKSMKSIVTYTRMMESTNEEDENLDTNKTTTIFYTGRLQEAVLKDHVSPAMAKTNAHAFLCGPTSFVMDMEAILIHLGVDGSKIQHESF